MVIADDHSDLRHRDVVILLMVNNRNGADLAAPSSTFDFESRDGDAIAIEHRGGEEVSVGFGIRTVPEGVDVYNPAFDVTPNNLITSIITERGVIEPVNADTVAALIKD
ncbi:MAG: methylthioribose-1-phosphate isomerase [Candidatus Azotimanducaceae bacterium]|jgi:methylthioribose-1-phosphate isomerase